MGDKQVSDAEALDRQEIAKAVEKDRATFETGPVIHSSTWSVRQISTSGSSLMTTDEIQRVLEAQADKE